MAHAHDLRAEVSDLPADEADLWVQSIVRDWRSANLTSPDRRLCQFASKLTLEQQRMSEADIESLRDVGFSDRAIHDAVQVIAYFNYITRIADGLGIAPEADLPGPSGSV